jgi:hypothetical protein
VTPKKYVMNSVKESLGINDERYKSILMKAIEIHNTSKNKDETIKKISEIATPDHVELLVMSYFVGVVGRDEIEVEVIPVVKK